MVCEATDALFPLTHAVASCPLLPGRDTLPPVNSPHPNLVTAAPAMLAALLVLNNTVGKLGTAVAAAAGSAAPGQNRDLLNWHTGDCGYRSAGALFF